MRPWLLLALVVLTGCRKLEEAPPAPAVDGRGHPVGRFMALGHYAPGRLWREIVRDAPPGDPKAARPEDDGEVLTVVDTRTGELRQCGNLSGACISFNPWSRRATELPQAPARLKLHLDEARAVDEAKDIDRKGTP